MEDKPMGQRPVDPEELRRALGTPQGKALLALIRAQDGELVRRAAAAAQAGDYVKAISLLAPSLEQAGLSGKDLTQHG